MAGNIKGITIELDGNTTKLTAALKGVNSAVRQTQAQLKTVEKALKLNPGNVTALQAKFSALGTKISEVKQKLALLKEAEQQAATQLANGEISQGQFDALQAEIAATTEELKALEREYANFGSVGAQHVAAVGAKLEEMGSKIATVGDKLTMGLTLPLAALGTAAVKNFAETDKTMQLVNSTMGNSTDEATLLNNAMKEAAANSTFGMSDAATASLNFARAGLDAQQAAAALAPAMNLAAGEGGDLETVSAGLVATINGFHGSFDQAAQYADVFANACNNSALDVNSMSQAMSVAAPIFSAAGYSVNDAALYMGVMANNGIEASVAANSLKTGFAKLVSPAADGAKAMSELGISITNADGSMKDSVQIQAELHQAFSQLSESEQIAAASAIFGKNQMAPWLALINSAPGDVAALSEALGEQGTATEMAASMMSGFGGALEKLKSSADVAMNSLGQALAPAISKVADGLQKAVDWFNALPPSVQQTIATVGLIVAAIGPVLAIGGRLIAGVGKLMGLAPMLVNAFNGVKTVFLAVKLIFMALSPATIAIVAAITAVIAIGVLLATHWDQVKAKAQELWASITATFSAIGSAISGAWNAVVAAGQAAWDAVVSAVQTAGEAIMSAWSAAGEAVSGVMSAIGNAVSTGWSAISSAVSTACSAISGVVSSVWSAISSFISGIVSTVASTVSSVWSGLVGTVSGIWTAVSSAASSAFSPVQGAISTVVSAVKNFLVNTWNGISGTVSGIFQAIKNAMTKPIEAAKTAISGAIDRIKGLFSTTIQGPNIKLPHITASGSFSLRPLSVPSFSISWYKDAYDSAMLFTSPTVLGTGSGFKGFGDGNGGELVIGERYLQEMIAQAAGTKSMDTRLARLESLVASGFEMVQQKEMKIKGADLIYGNRNNINKIMGSEATLASRGVK